MKWISRERSKINRIACPWLIKAFVDPEAEFIYVPREQVFDKTQEPGAVPCNIPEAEYTRYVGECTFDDIVRKRHLTDPAIWELARIVRADTDRFALAPQARAGGLFRLVFPITSGTITRYWQQDGKFMMPSTVGASMFTRRSIPGALTCHTANRGSACCGKQ